MPLIEIHLLEGRTDEQKRALLQAVTDAVQTSVGASLESIRVWINEFSRTEYMAAGVLAADKKNVVVVRHAEGKRHAALLDLSKSLSTPRAEPFYLAPQDIVYVSATSIDKLNMFIEKHINQVIPAGFTYSQSTGNKSSMGYSPPYYRPDRF